jgi:tRNA-specific 2-thiouridylase
MDRPKPTCSEPPARGSLYGGKVADSLADRSSVGRLESPSGVGQAGSTACGALVRVEVALADGILVDAKYQAYGCPATLACAAATVERARGMAILGAAGVGSVELAASLELAADKISCAETAIDALHNALGAAVMSGVSSGEPVKEGDPIGVLVGMSGGVDSAVAALLLQKQGYRVVGVTLGLWNDPHSGGERSCCSPETVRRARRVAHSLGIPHITIDASQIFNQSVVSYFVEEYEGGRTPNPCAKCNSRVRFGLMLEVAKWLGLSWVATGHYARLFGDDRVLSRGVDELKDQSYVLAEVDPAVLRRALFPLGSMTKREVRGLAAEAGLEGHAAPESQEICFVADDDHRRFLRERLGARPGQVVDRAGNRLAEHLGTYNFTIGQRKGLGIPSEGPLYVVEIDAGRAEVVVGAADDLDVCEVTIGTLTWHQPLSLGPLFLQVRSSGAPLSAHAGRDASASATVDLVTVVVDRPARAVALGQTAVVYRDELVVCAGTILATGSERPSVRGSPGGA